MESDWEERYNALLATLGSSTSSGNKMNEDDNRRRQSAAINPYAYNIESDRALGLDMRSITPSSMKHSSMMIMENIPNITDVANVTNSSPSLLGGDGNIYAFNSSPEEKQDSARRASSTLSWSGTSQRRDMKSPVDSAMSLRDLTNNNNNNNSNAVATSSRQQQQMDRSSPLMELATSAGSPSMMYLNNNTSSNNSMMMMNANYLGGQGMMIMQPPQSTTFGGNAVMPPAPPFQQQQQMLSMSSDPYMNHILGSQSGGGYDQMYWMARGNPPTALGADHPLRSALKYDLVSRQNTPLPGASPFTMVRGGFGKKAKQLSTQQSEAPSANRFASPNTMMRSTSSPMTRTRSSSPQRFMQTTDSWAKKSEKEVRSKDTVASGVVNWR